MAAVAEHASDADAPAMPASGEVTIYRDDWGVPRIYRRRDAEGFCGVGYAQARDQLGFILHVLTVRK